MLKDGAVADQLVQCASVGEKLNKPSGCRRKERVPGWAANGLGRTMLAWRARGGGEPEVFFLFSVRK